MNVVINNFFFLLASVICSDEGADSCAVDGYGDT